MTEFEPSKAIRDAHYSYQRAVLVHCNAMLEDRKGEARSHVDWKKAFCDAKQCDLTIW